MKKNSSVAPPLKGAKREEQIIKRRSNEGIAEGKIKSRRPAAFWRALDDERTTTLIKMVKERATLQEMGIALGCTRERVRQVVRLIKEVYGESVFVSDERILTPQEAAGELGLEIQLVQSLCRKGDIPTRRRGVRGYLIGEEGMCLLRVHPYVIGKRTCVICGRQYVYEVGTGYTVCSDECRAKGRGQRREAYAEQEPSSDSLGEWQRELWQRRKCHRLPQDERWLPISEAAKRAGLTHTQLRWLQHRRLVTLRPDPLKKWRGQPVATYAASEMDIARQVYEVFQKKRENKP